MRGYEMDTKIRRWSELHFIAFELQIRRMEDEILWYRKERLAGLSPSSFSYYLYEKKIDRMREKWEKLYEYQEISQWLALEKLIKERIYEVLKQDRIMALDYPQNKEILQMKAIHENFCIGWLLCLSFNAPIPEENQPSSKDFDTEMSRYGCMF